jgi:aspartate racemase
MMNDALTLGVIGGLGPAATLKFLEQLQAHTPAEREQDHIRVIADINPRIPDLATPGSGAGPVLAEMAGALGGAGADVLAMPCNAAHVHADLIQHASGLPLIDMIGLGAGAAAETGAARVGVLGGKAALRLYREYLAAQAIGLVILPAERQDAFMATLARIKSGDLGDEVRAHMRGYAEALRGLGAETIIAGCTEATLALPRQDVKIDLIDPGDLLARRAVAVCFGWEPLPQVLA